MFHLFRKHCAYCKSGSVINEGQVICSRRGVVDSADHCRHFCYDPLKRVPLRPATLRDQYTSEDFSL